VEEKKKKELNEWADRASKLLVRVCSGSPQALAEDLAYTVGRKAARLGVGPTELNGWFDRAFRPGWPPACWPHERTIRRSLMSGFGVRLDWKLKRAKSMKGKRK
jgi:hypothetical protein